MEDLIIDRFGKSLTEEERKILIDIEKLQKNLPARYKCTLLFKNNLFVSNSTNFEINIKYLKIGHVIEGHDVFVYERVNIENNKSILFDNYIIGGALGDVSAITTTPVSKPVKENNKIDLDNLYDRLYVQFVLEKKFYDNAGNLIETIEYLYNQSYNQFLKFFHMKIV